MRCLKLLKNVIDEMWQCSMGEMKENLMSNSKKIISYLIPDQVFIKHKYYVRMGIKLDLKHPKRYTEKLQWLKLHLRKHQFIKMVDKYEVKPYVASIIGDEYIIPTLGVWNHFDEIDFNSLPNSFVLKCTHDSGGIFIVKDKNQMDMDRAKSILETSLKRDYYIAGREWPYKKVKRRIIAEKYLEDSNDKELRDYKFFAFDGKVPYMFIATDRFKDSDTCFDFYDSEFNHLNIINGHPNAKFKPSKPSNFQLMLELASKLSIGIPHVRVDFYEVDGRVYFGELTLFHHSGFVPFEPDEWDYKFGEWIKLPTK